MKLHYFLAAILCAAPSLAYAAEENTPLEILIVTGTRMSQPLKQALPHSTVITEQDIQASQAVDVPTLLRSLAGVEVVQGGGLGKQSSIFMRGTNSSHVLVLLDGVRINSATTGMTALEHIMLDSIERIEVVRGNVSSLYGSEAIGGVIQLFTKRGRGAPAFNASAGLGSHGTKRLAAGFSGSADATSFSVNAGKVKTDGVSAINTGIAMANPDKDGYDNTTLSAQVQHAINTDHQLSASLFNTRGDSQYDTVYDAFFNPTATTDLNNTKSAIEKLSLTSDDRVSAMWHSKLNLARGTDNSRDYLNGAEQGHIKTVNNQLSWQNELRLADTQLINLTVERSEQSVTSTTLFTQTRRGVNSLLGGYVGEYGAQQVQFNLRQDRYPDFGAADTGLLGYGISFADNWRASASISNAFKAPTFNDMYAPVSWGGNPNLRPERANNREISLRYALGGQQVDLDYFDNRIHDLIVYQFPLMMNVNQARIDGMEVSYAGEFGDTHLKANVTLQNPRDTSTGQVLLRRAKSYGNLGVTQKAGAWRVGGEVQYSGTREDIDINTNARITLGSYNVVNLTASYALDNRLDLSLRADNLFDRNYMMVHGYNTLGRTLFVGLNYQQ